MVPRKQYRFQGVISATVFGLLLLVSGLDGLDLRYSHGWFAGVKWVEGPVWVQVVIGAGMLASAVVLARRAVRHAPELPPAAGGSRWFSRPPPV